MSKTPLDLTHGDRLDMMNGFSHIREGSCVMYKLSRVPFARRNRLVERAVYLFLGEESWLVNGVP